MWWESFFREWLLPSAVSSSIVLLVGAPAVLACRQPVRRLLLARLSILAALLVPFVPLVPGYPQLLIPAWSEARDPLPEPPGEPSPVGHRSSGRRGSEVRGVGPGIRAAAAIQRAGYRVTWDESGHVSKVFVGWRKLDDELMRHVKDLPRLNHLAFCGAVITGGYLAGLKNLRTLSSHQYGVFTKDAMKDLGGLANLEELTGLPILLVSETKEGESEVRLKRHRERTQGLIEATAADLEHLNGLRKLRLLGLRGHGITDTALRYLKPLTNLRELSISYAPFTGAGLLHLRDLKQLRSLAIRGGCPVTDDGLSHVAALTNLEELSLDVRGVTGTGLVHLRTLRHLHTLRLRGDHVTDASLKNLKNLDHLKKLYLAWNKISDDAIRHLAPLTALEELDLRHTGVTGASLVLLKDLPRLRSLDLGNLAITDDHLSILQEFPALENLDLYDTGITPAGLKHLSRLKQLKKLTVDAREVTEAGENQLKRALPNCEIR